MRDYELMLGVVCVCVLVRVDLQHRLWVWDGSHSAHVIMKAYAIRFAYGNFVW